MIFCSALTKSTISRTHCAAGSRFIPMSCTSFGPASRWAPCRHPPDRAAQELAGHGPALRFCLGQPPLDRAVRRAPIREGHSGKQRPCAGDNGPRPALLEAEGAEFMMIGLLLIEGIQCYKAHTNFPYSTPFGSLGLQLSCRMKARCSEHREPRIATYYQTLRSHRRETYVRGSRKATDESVSD
jgi:hypothetical protein